MGSVSKDHFCERRFCDRRGLAQCHHRVDLHPEDRLRDQGPIHLFELVLQQQFVLAVAVGIVAGGGVAGVAHFNPLASNTPADSRRSSDNILLVGGHVHANSSEKRTSSSRQFSTSHLVSGKSSSCAACHGRPETPFILRGLKFRRLTLWVVVRGIGAVLLLLVGRRIRSPVERLRGVLSIRIVVRL